MELKRKVLAYITKGEDAEREILVFEQKDNPNAGLQVPGGTIEEGELLIDALYREIEEETGINREDLELKRKINTSNYFPQHKNVIYERNIFHLTFIGKEQARLGSPCIRRWQRRRFDIFPSLDTHQQVARTCRQSRPGNRIYIRKAQGARKTRQA